MATVLDVVKRILPNGTTGQNDWSVAPTWPPDLFAAVATIANMSGCYSEAPFTAGLTGDGYFSRAFRTEVTEQVVGARRLETKGDCGTGCSGGE